MGVADSGGAGSVASVELDFGDGAAGNFGGGDDCDAGDGADRGEVWGAADGAGGGDALLFDAVVAGDGGEFLATGVGAGGAGDVVWGDECGDQFAGGDCGAGVWAADHGGVSCVFQFGRNGGGGGGRGNDGGGSSGVDALFDCGGGAGDDGGGCSAADVAGAGEAYGRERLRGGRGWRRVFIRIFCCWGW